MIANTFISKEQFCRDYHVGKATALWLIQTGLLPAIDTGRKTGRYLIADTDIQTYLHQRELDPKKYRYKGTPPSSSGVSLEPRQARAALAGLWSDIPDLLRLRDVAQLLGYDERVIVRWRREWGLQYLQASQFIYYPKQYLIDFILSPLGQTQYPKSPEHIELLNKIYLPNAP